MPATATMKADVIHSFGGPEVIQLEDIPTPQPGRGEILVRIYAAGVNPVDWKIREGFMQTVPLPSILGNDFSGVVQTVGEGLEHFRAGQEVFGSTADRSGSYAEYAIAPANYVARKPANLDHVQAAALPIAALTAWQALFDKGDVQPGQRVLIHAAAGGVGSFAVQFAKWKGAYVIGTASAHHMNFVKRLGADEVIDYRNDRFEDLALGVDMVLDTIGGDTQERSWKVLKRGGILVSIVQPPSQSALEAHGVRGLIFRCDHGRGDELEHIGQLVANGAIHVHVETVLPLSEARRAQELSQKGHTTGKIVLRVS